jgi:CTP synthase
VTSRPPVRHIFVTGGVVSSLGKGLTSAAIALLLGRRGYRVRLQKMDPYLNVDAGTMSPYQHGEVYVTEDGAETDLDLGHYERFTGVPCTRAGNVTAGRIYSNVLAREREGGYLGRTIQVIPHVTDEIKASIRALAEDGVDIVITEIGGTVGDIESLPFLEAIRQFRQEIGRSNGLFVHITLVPYIRAAGELKTKPSQQSVGVLRSIGLFPDILIARCERPMNQEHRDKLALFCNVEPKLVIEERDVAHTIYEVPLDLYRQELDVYILELLGLHVRPIAMTDWEQMVERIIHPARGTVEIAVVGKYITLSDAYKSLYEALTHGGIANNVAVAIRRVESEKVETEGPDACLAGCHGILVPGGFGDRGIEGKIAAIQYARERRIPFFGICLGLQCAVIEFARHRCGLADAHSAEFAPATPHPVIHLMESQTHVRQKGGTMRLGAWPCHLRTDSRAFEAYQRPIVSERHRHRYEVNNAYRELLESKGLRLTGLSPDGQLVEIIEIPDHPWFVGCQFHPEFQSTPLQAHPLFVGFIGAALRARDEGKESHA